jgi:hypothetical protein
MLPILNVDYSLFNPPTLPWYRAGGIPLANVVAAWRFKGAVSYALSVVDLVNGHTLTNGSAPTWDALTGYSWIGSKYLKTDIVPTATMAILISVSGIEATGSNHLFGAREGTGVHFRLQPVVGANTFTYFWGGKSATVARAGNAANVYGLGPQWYWTDQTQTAFVGTWTNFTDKPIYLQAYNNNGAVGGQLNQAGFSVAMSIYDPAPTAAQLLAVDNAMRAL